MAISSSLALEIAQRFMLRSYLTLPSLFIHFVSSSLLFVNLFGHLVLWHFVLWLAPAITCACGLARLVSNRIIDR